MTEKMIKTDKIANNVTEFQHEKQWNIVHVHCSSYSTNQNI